MSAEEIVSRGGAEPTRLLWPARGTYFAERAMRLRQLSRNHAIGDYLALMADIAQAQHDCLAGFAEVPLPQAAELAAARQRQTAPLHVADWTRDPAWRDGLRLMLDRLRDKVPASVRPMLETLRAADTDYLEAQADALLAGRISAVDLAQASFISAALQVYWVHMVTACHALRAPEQYAALDLDKETTCPCCGSPPTASMVRAEGGMAGLRYLSCSLCGTQWNMVRIQCTCCLGEKQVSYLSLSLADAPEDEDSRATPSAVQAEACDECGSYMKIMHVDREPFVDPVADDLASLPLDVLVSESGKMRRGVNLMLWFSQTDTPE